MYEFPDTQSILKYRDSLANNVRIGFIPTMGNLHVGHGSLIAESSKENAITIVSIFVNRLQFAPHEDFQSYPRTQEADLKYCKSLGVDAVFLPSECDIYGSVESTVFDTSVIVGNGQADRNANAEGASRPTFFKGVATTVSKLFNIVLPTHVYFGQKDGQQAAVINQLINDMYPRIKLRLCDTVREESGLALSSRNSYLTEDQRKHAAILFFALSAGQKCWQAGDRDAGVIKEAVVTVIEDNGEVSKSGQLVELEYVSVCDSLSMREFDGAIADKVSCMICIAAKVGTARLIDNIVLR